MSSANVSAVTNGFSRIPKHLLVLAIVGMVLPGILELLSYSQMDYVRFIYLVPAFILAYYGGITGGFITIFTAFISTVLIQVIQALMGRSVPWEHWINHDLPNLGTMFFFTLSVGVFAERLIAKQRLLEKANIELKQMALTDELTKVYNHRYFQMRLQEEISRAHRQGHLVSLMMLDVDFFKQYNDLLGHQAGDEALRQISQILKDNVRIMDAVARYGGEEFAIILPDTGSEQAAMVAHRIRLAVAEYPFAGREEQPGGQVTVSIGIATYPNNADNRHDLIAKADEALYRVKRERKNSVQIYFALSTDQKQLEVRR